jgi:hypothetical protein
MPHLVRAFFADLDLRYITAATGAVPASAGHASLAAWTSPTAVLAGRFAADSVLGKVDWLRATALSLGWGELAQGSVRSSCVEML